MLPKFEEIRHLTASYLFTASLPAVGPFLACGCGKCTSSSFDHDQPCYKVLWFYVKLLGSWAPFCDWLRPLPRPLVVHGCEANWFIINPYYTFPPSFITTGQTDTQTNKQRWKHTFFRGGHIELSQNTVCRLLLKNAYRVTEFWSYRRDYYIWPSELKIWNGGGEKYESEIQNCPQDTQEDQWRRKYLNHLLK